MNHKGPVYLNQAGTSWPKPPAVREASQRFSASDPLEWPAIFAGARRTIVDFFEIPDSSRLLFTSSCTMALSIAVADHLWKPGDRVLTSGYEHHALHRPLVKLTEQGVQMELVRGADYELIDLDELEKRLSCGGVRMVAVSAACNVTGDLLPYRDIIQLAHQYGALALIDAAQIAGWWNLNVPELGADLLAFAGHKGPHAPWGIGGLYVAPHVTMNSPAAHCELPRNGNPGGCSAMPGFCDAGSVDLAALTGMAAAIDWLNESAQEMRLDHARSLAGRLYDSLAEMPPVRVYGNPEPDRRMPTVAMNVAEKSPADVARFLRERGIVAAAGLQCSPLAHQSLGTSPDGVVRLSVGPGSTADDIDAVLSAVGELLQPAAN